jgi:hypothetical protein
VTLLGTQDKEWCFLRVEGEHPGGEDPFFDGRRHPYDCASANLLRDALFFGAAAVRALVALDPAADWVLLPQDWEAATAVLAWRGLGRTGPCHLTLHNSYDTGCREESLGEVGIPPGRSWGDTVLQRAIPLVASPLFTVSRQFALDLTEDILQREAVAPHLQTLLATRGVAGIDNGPFKPLEVPEDLLASAREGRTDALFRWKREARRRAGEALGRLRPSHDTPVWGDPSRIGAEDGAPWFVMAGRDDSRQKGYDVAAAAVEEYLAHPGRHAGGRFFFFPIPGDEGLEGLAFLRQLAQRHPGEVLVLPFIWREGFATVLEGAAFGLMPSLYEPFGMANEFYLSGCAGIGRATGGIVQQIVPLRTSRPGNRPALALADRHHRPGAPATGLLYREEVTPAAAREGWETINRGGYGPGRRLAQRRGNTLFRSMVRGLVSCLEEGALLWSRDPAAVLRMTARGTGHVAATFSWERAGREYAAHLLPRGGGSP